MSKRHGSGQAAGGLLSPWLERQRILRSVRWVPHGADIFDVGCGRARLLHHLPAVHSYVGLDLLDEVLAANRTEFPLHQFFRLNIETESLPFRVGQFDVMVMLAVLEHFQTPTKTMLKVMPFLRKEGRIILTTPHRTARSIHELGSVIGIFSREAAREHNSFFDKSCLESLASELGMRMTRYERFQFGLNQIAVMQRV